MLVMAVNSSRASSNSERSSKELPLGMSESAKSEALAFNAFRAGMVLSQIGEFPRRAISASRYSAAVDIVGVRLTRLELQR